MAGALPKAIYTFTEIPRKTITTLRPADLANEEADICIRIMKKEKRINTSFSCFQRSGCFSEWEPLNRLKSEPLFKNSQELLSSKNCPNLHVPNKLLDSGF